MKQIYFLFLALMLSIGTVQAGGMPDFAVANADGVMISYIKCEHWFSDTGCEENNVLVTWQADETPYIGEVIIPETVTYEGITYNVMGILNPFSNCPDLTGIGIPASVSFIHKYTFGDNLNLMDIYVSWSDPSTLTIDPAIEAGSSFPDLTAANITLHVPVGAKAAYESSDVWKVFNIVDDGRTFRDENSTARLANLAVSYGTLSPAFSAAQLTYRLTVPLSVDQITLTATPMYGGAVTGDGQKQLNIGENTFNMIVTSANGALQNTYTVTVERKEVDPELANLTVNYGILSPAFKTTQFTYRLVVPQSVDRITLTATPTYDNTVSGDGERTLNTGENTLDITVTSADGNRQNTYTITVYRHSEDCLMELNENITLKYGTVYTSFYWPSTGTQYNNVSVSVVNGYSFYYTLYTGNLSGDLPLVFDLNEGVKTCNRTLVAEPHSIYKIKLDIAVEYFGNGQYALSFTTTADAYGRPGTTRANYNYYSMPIRVTTGGNPLHEGEVQMTGFPNTATISDVTLEWHTGITSAESNPLRVYSDPASDRLTLSGLQGNETLRIYSISGNLLLSDKATGETTTIDIAHLPAGIYLVGIQGDKGVSTHKIIKQ